MSLTCALLLLSVLYPENVELNIVPCRDLDHRLIIAVFVFFSGLIVSIYYAFTDRPKSNLKKSLCCSVGHPWRRTFLSKQRTRARLSAAP
jgi:hypothetical protein